jgi:hypothetical protein
MENFPVAKCAHIDLLLIENWLNMRRLRKNQAGQDGLFFSEYDSAFGQVIRGHFHRHRITGQNADKIQAHLSADMSDDHVFVFEFHSEHRVRKQLLDHSLNFDYIF